MGGETILVALQSAQYGEKIYPEWDDMSKDADHRLIYSWQTKPDLTTMRYFNLSGVYLQGAMRVRFNSVFHVAAGEPLMSPPEKSYMFDTQRRPVYCWRNKTSPPPVDSIDWFMETDIGNQSSLVINRYRFMNVLTKEYLFSDANNTSIDTYRRRIMTAPGPKNPLFGTQGELWDVVEIPRNCSCTTVYN